MPIHSFHCACSSLLLLYTTSLVRASPGQGYRTSPAPRNLGPMQASQCPCMDSTNSKWGINYNPDFQAINLQEALRNFHDLTTMDSKTTIDPKALDPPNLRTTQGCATDYCRKCAKYIFGHIADQMMASYSADTFMRNASMNDVNSLMRTYGADRVLQNDCTQISLGHVHQDNMWVSVSTKDMNKIERQIQNPGIQTGWGVQSANRGVSDPCPPPPPPCPQPEPRYQTSGDARFPGHHTSEGRGRRQAPTISPEITQRYSVKCFDRGAVIDSGTNYLGLCNMCWQWGVLSNEFYPRYVNMVSCGTDNQCLSGWGQCRERTRSLDVLRNMGTTEQPDWRPYTLTIPTSCDCQVQAGSTLSNLVKG